MLLGRVPGGHSEIEEVTPGSHQDARGDGDPYRVGDPENGQQDESRYQGAGRRPKGVDSVEEGHAPAEGCFLCDRHDE